MKYKFVKNLYSFNIEISKDNDLYSDLSSADMIFGCNTMALVVGTWLNKRVFCAIPPKGFGFNLPKKGIEFIHDILPNDDFEKVWKIFFLGN